jgi:hypothetical protein
MSASLTANPSCFFGNEVPLKALVVTPALARTLLVWGFTEIICQN